jgi:hypothetical protein
MPAEWLDVGAIGDEPIVGVNEIRISVDDADIRVLGEDFPDGFKCAGGVGVVGIQPAEDFAPGSGKALGNGVGLAAIWLAGPG